MFRHISLLRWVDQATAEQRGAVESALATLPGEIPEIRSYTVGADAGINDGNFDLAVVADFDNVNDYLVYRDHPVHVAMIAEFIRPILAERAAIQHEI